MKKQLVLIPVIALTSAFANAQSPDASASPTPQPGEDNSGRPPGPPHRPPPPLVEALDKNHDRVIDASEISDAPKSLLTLDKNNDGQLTMEELRPPRPPQEGENQGGKPDGSPPPRHERGGQNGGGQNRGGRRGMPLMEALDANHDRTIDASEIANASKALLTLDKNNDGQLTREELMPPPPPEGKSHEEGTGGSGGQGGLDHPPGKAGGPPPPRK